MEQSGAGGSGESPVPHASFPVPRPGSPSPVPHVPFWFPQSGSLCPILVPPARFSAWFPLPQPGSRPHADLAWPGFWHGTPGDGVGVFFFSLWPHCQGSTAVWGLMD